MAARLYAPMSQIKAILGPTNTGKTHYAIDRMLGHASGMIGLPLRLLAREVYDKVVAIKGKAAAALITGEERIWPASARYFICTVEAMPMSQKVEFLAVDEIQLAEDSERGYIFTDRILHARGTYETLLLGAETMRPILYALDLDVETEPRERFSELTYTGPVKVTKLPKRTAIVAFTSEQVYAIAELLRRQKGGAAVIMGALNPRTRNAQVELYQSGEVDYLVATDAIGMGLNLDIDHVAFAGATKFDGRRQRPLRPSELAQIAGRAGRFRSQGTFGETGDCRQFDEDLVRRVENHKFEPVSQIDWRNSALNLKSLSALMQSLAKPSGLGVLRQNPNALDEWTLRRMALLPDIVAEASNESRVRRLWDLCRLPNFRKAGHEGHFRLVQALTEHLADPEARLSDTAMENRLKRLQDPLGDIPTLQEKLAGIRTWTYAAYRDDWLENADFWRDKTRKIEDKLSDALHGALTARFVDRRTTALLAGLKKDHALMTDIQEDGAILVEGHIVGHLKGLTFEPDTTARTLEGKAVRNAAQTALQPILAKRLADIASADDAAFSLDEDGKIAFGGHPIASLGKGGDWLSPVTVLIGASDVPADAKEPARMRTQNWLAAQITKLLPAHAKLKSGEAQEGLEGHAKGIAFRIMETGAAIDLRADDPAARIEADQREILKTLGLRTGRLAAHAPDAQKPAAQRLIAQLRTVFEGKPCRTAPAGAGSFALDGNWPDADLLANGYLRFGPRAIRADLAERLAWEISKRRKEAEKNLFALAPELASIVSCPGDTFPTVLKGFGLVPAEHDAETGVPTMWRYGRRQLGDKAHAKGQSGKGQSNRTVRSDGDDKAGKGRRKMSGHGSGQGSGKGAGKPRRRQEKRADPNSPFAALAALIPAEKPKPAKRRKTAPQKTAKNPEKTADNAAPAAENATPAASDANTPTPE